MEEIQRAGFVRVRIDGIIYRVEEALEKTLVRYKKHDIEVVVDRLILDKNLDNLRLIDSLETALKLGRGGTAIVIINSLGLKNKTTGLENTLLFSGSARFNLAREKTNPQFEIIFSERFTCERCGISLPDLEPRLFSFNSPYGACPSCQGLGEKLEVDPKLVIPNPNLSIAEGAIFPWAHASHKIGRQGFFGWMLKNFSERENIDLYTPVKNLSKEKIEKILYGGIEFEGIIPWLEKRYHETEYTRQEIEQYMTEKNARFVREKD